MPNPEIGPFNKISFNANASLEIQVDGSVTLKTGDESFVGSVYNFGSDGVIMADGVPYQAVPSTPSTPEVIPFTVPTFAANWSNFTGPTPFAKAGYRKHLDGTVELNGLVTRVGTVGTTIFNLPAGFRPATQKAFLVPTYLDGVDYLACVKVLPNGNVNLSTGSAAALFLTGIRFPLI